MDQSFFLVSSVFVVSAHGFCCSGQVVDSGKLGHVEAVGIEVCIRQRKYTDKGSMAQNP